MKRHAALATLAGLSALGLGAATFVSVQMANEATAQAARSHATQQILTDVFKKADPFSGQGGAVTLADALVRAKPEIAARVEEDPLLAWEVNRTLSQIYQELGLIEEEREAYQAMLTAADRLDPDPTDPRHLEGIAGMGSVLARTNPVEAVRYLDAKLPARPGSREALPPWLSAQYSYVGALSRVRELGRADTATFVMADVMDAYGVERPRTRGRLSQLLAEVARRAGDIEAEDRHRLDTVEFMREAGNPSALAVILNNYAIYLGRRRRYEASEAAFKEALSIFEDADLRDPTFATVLRSYAGLLFRTDRLREAIAATERSLSLLPAESQFYARFVAERNLAQYRFIQGDGVATLEIMLRALPSAFEAFDDPSVPRRMHRLFVKAMLFGGAEAEARAALGLSPGACTGAALAGAVEALESKKDETSRRAVVDALGALEAKRDASTLAQADVDGFVAFYAAERPLFHDAWDRWSVLKRLDALARSAELSFPQAAREALDALDASRARLTKRLASPGDPRHRQIAEKLGASGAPSACPR